MMRLEVSVKERQNSEFIKKKKFMYVKERKP
jgi:hypothetical protein